MARRRARALIRAVGARALTEREGKAILALYGIRTTREILAADSEHAVAAAETIGYPVALKAESPLLLHKNTAGAVILNVTDETMLRSRFKRALTNAWSAVPSDSVTGVLVQEMIEPGTEVRLRMGVDDEALARFAEVCQDLGDLVQRIEVQLLGDCAVDCVIVPDGAAT